MKNLILYLVKNLVKNPDTVEVRSENDPAHHNLIYFVKVDNDDRGKVIGRDGKIIQSITTIVSSVASTHVQIKLED